MYRLTFVGYFDSGTFNIKTGKVECSDESVTTYYFGDPQSDHMEYTLYVLSLIHISARAWHNKPR